jgi:hypothetical protein
MNLRELDDNHIRLPSWGAMVGFDFTDGGSAMVELSLADIFQLLNCLKRVEKTSLEPDIRVIESLDHILDRLGEEDYRLHTVTALVPIAQVAAELIPIIDAEDPRVGRAMRKRLKETKAPNSSTFQKDAYQTLHRIYSKHRRKYRGNPDSNQMCCMWSTDDPPDVIENTEPIGDIEEAFEIILEEEAAMELYDLDLEAAVLRILEIRNEQ